MCFRFATQTWMICGTFSNLGRRIRYNQQNSYIKGINPYTKRKSLKNVYVDNNTVTAAYDVVSVSECMGHFRNYPCLPAAVIGGLFGDLGTHLLEHVTGYKVSVSTITHSFTVKNFRILHPNIYLKDGL